MRCVVSIAFHPHPAWLHRDLCRHACMTHPTLVSSPTQYKLLASEYRCLVGCVGLWVKCLPVELEIDS